MEEDNACVLLQRYHRDRRMLLNFILSGSLGEKLVMPPGAVSLDDVDVDQVSVDYVLNCAKKGEMLDLSEAIRLYHDSLEYPSMAHKNAKPFINKSISHFQDSKLICHDDKPTGQFAKLIFQKFGVPSSSFIQADDTLEEEGIDINCVDIPTIEPLGGSPPPQASYSADSSAHATAREPVRGGRGVNIANQVANNISSCLNEVVGVLRLIQITLANQLVTFADRLAFVMYNFDGFNGLGLDKFHTHLCGDKKQVEIFLGKSQQFQRQYIEEFIECRRMGRPYRGIGISNSI